MRDLVPKKPRYPYDIYEVPTKIPMFLGPVTLYTGEHHNPIPNIWDYSTIDKWEEAIREWVRFRIKYQDDHKFDDGIYL
jgi:hypothetical protein